MKPTEVWIAPSTGDAYDWIQMDMIPDGVTLYSPEEQVVGVSGTWPVAVTCDHGAFHCYFDFVPASDRCEGHPGYMAAVEFALKMGLAVAPFEVC